MYCSLLFGATVLKQPYIQIQSAVFGAFLKLSWSILGQILYFLVYFTVIFFVTKHQESLVLLAK